jgi:hypothetical protein
MGNWDLKKGLVIFDGIRLTFASITPLDLMGTAKDP